MKPKGEFPHFRKSKEELSEEKLLADFPDWFLQDKSCTLCNGTGRLGNGLKYDFCPCGCHTSAQRNSLSYEHFASLKTEIKILQSRLDESNAQREIATLKKQLEEKDNYVSELTDQWKFCVSKNKELQQQLSNSIKKEEIEKIFDALWFGQNGLEDLKGLHLIKASFLKKHCKSMIDRFVNIRKELLKGEKG